MSVKRYVLLPLQWKSSIGGEVALVLDDLPGAALPAGAARSAVSYPATATTATAAIVAGVQRPKSAGSPGEDLDLDLGLHENPSTGCLLGPKSSTRV